MALVIADLVQETTSTTGTGTLTLTGAVTGFQTFAAIGNANTTYYRIKSGTDSEVGIGTYTLSGTTLSRDTVLYSTAGGTTKITVAADATVICTYPAEKAVAFDAVGNLGVGGTSAVNKLTVADTTLATGSGAGSLVDLSQTWNNAAGNPTAIKLNVTNTNSGATAKLMDLQVGGVSFVTISKAGVITLDNGASGNTNKITLSAASGLALRQDKLISWSDSVTSSTPSTFLLCDAIGIVAQRNSTNAQTFRLYNTYTDASNFERVSVSFNKPDAAVFTGYINSGTTLVSGTVLTVTAITSGVIRTGMVLVGTGITTNTNITAFIPTTGGTGGTGTYTVGTAHAMASTGVSITGTSSLTAPYAIVGAESGGTGAANIGIALSPKGTGAITAQVPDGTTAGGNARGANSIDLQTSRYSASQVASGSGSVAIGVNCTSAGSNSISIGNGANASGNNSIVLGQNGSASATGSVCLNRGGAASGSDSIAMGNSAQATKPAQLSVGYGTVGFVGDSQYSFLIGAVSTSTSVFTAVQLLPNGSIFGIPNNITWAADIDIVARSTSGADNAYFKRRLIIKRVANAASTALVGAVQTVGVDMGSNANLPPTGWDVSFGADTTNGALQIFVTGSSAAAVRWVAKVSLVEIGLA